MQLIINIAAGLTTLAALSFGAFWTIDKVAEWLHKNNVGGGTTIILTWGTIIVGSVVAGLIFGE